LARHSVHGYRDFQGLPRGGDRIEWRKIDFPARNEVAAVMAGLKKMLCFVVLTAHVAAVSTASAETLSPQRAATGAGKSVAAREAQAEAGNASGQSSGKDQPPPYIPPSHGMAQALILGSVAAAAAVAAFLAANKQDSTTSTSSTTSTQ